MADTSHGTGGLSFDKSKKTWPSELNILLALVIIIVVFEIIGQVAPYIPFVLVTPGNMADFMDKN